MTVSGTDSLGAFVDTGSNTQPTVRPSTEVETHSALEIDSGAKIPSNQTVATFHPRGVPHRGPSSPR